ncbi:MAG: hypothetical protein AAGA54_20600 [Myxococcota bacterium]
MALAPAFAWFAATADLFCPSAPAPAAATVAPRNARVEGVPELVYVNFGGAVLQEGCGNDARLDCSTLAGQFDGYVGPFRGNASQRLSIIQAARRGAADFGIRIVTERPPDDVPYTMIVYGDLGEQSFAGVAPYLDCGDERRGDTAFSQGATGSNTGATLILHEAGHTWGLEHVDAETDIMHPSVVSNLTQQFVDSCFGIVADTGLGRTAGTCNEIHTRYCEPTFQNSRQTLLDLFGPTIPDVESPELEIVFPPDGATFVAPISFSLRADVVDDLHPQFYDVELFNGDTPVGTRNDLGVEDQLEFLVERPPPGDYALRVVIRDEAGNENEDMVRFTILPEGSEIEDDGPATVGDGGCRQGRPTHAWMWLAMLGFLKRRRLMARQSARCASVARRLC